MRFYQYVMLLCHYKKFSRLQKLSRYPALILGQKKKKELVLRPRRMYFLPPAFNFFQPQNVKKNLKQFLVNPDFLVHSCPFQF